MATRAGSKQTRPTGKGTLKTTGKDQSKGDKQPTNILEIVPGKFNEADWLSLLENDDTEDFIADIFEGIWTDTSKQIQQLYIRKQLLPFTLMMTENALSNVIQWAFLERDEPKPAAGEFWREDAEPVPSTMDNWGEGVVPACREERPQSTDESPAFIVERPATAPLMISTSEKIDYTRQRPSTGSSVTSSIETPHSSRQSKQLPPRDESISIHSHQQQEKSIKTESDDRTLTQKDFSTERTASRRSSAEPRPYYHDVLVIQSQPPKLEPLSDLFYRPQPPEKSPSAHSTSVPPTTKHRRVIAPKASSQLGSDAVVPTANISEAATTKNYKKPLEPKVSLDQQIEDVIAKAPVATHSILKSILSRPPGYRELELDDYGNVVAITKLDLDKMAPKNIRLRCDVVKPRKSVVDIRPPPIKAPQPKRSNRLESNFTAVKMVLPEQSTDVGDLIQPAPGVLYEDHRLKKGDPRRYQSGLNKYTNFHDESRPLRPIAQRGDLSLIQAANDFLGQANDEHNDDERDSQIPKLHRLARIPPIMSASSTTST